MYFRRACPDAITIGVYHCLVVSSCRSDRGKPGRSEIIPPCSGERSDETNMRIPHSDDGGRLSTNMTPMIDVVFLLIIFFLVSSHLARQESRLPLDLPAASTHLEDVEPPNVLTINVDKQARWMIAGTRVDERRLAEVLAAHRDKHGPDAAVRIRTEHTIAYGRVEPILRLSAEAGLWNAAFAVHQP